LRPLSRPGESGPHPGNRRFDLSGLRKPPEFIFGKDQRFVGSDFEGASRAFVQLRIDAEAPFEVSRQTGGPGLVISNDAIFDCDAHGNLFFVFSGGRRPMKVNSFCAIDIPGLSPSLNDTRAIIVDFPEMKLW